jgi:hypothetical protein
MKRGFAALKKAKVSAYISIYKSCLKSSLSVRSFRAEPWVYALLLSESSHTDFTIIDNDEAISPNFWGNVYYEPIHRTLGLFYSCWPNAQADNSMVLS